MTRISKIGGQSVKAKRTRSQIGKGSRRKGHSFERWVANELKSIGLADAHRQPQSQITLLKQINETLPEGKKRALTDVVAGVFALECKHRKVLPKIEQTLKQAEDDSAGSGLIPLAVHKQDGMTGNDILVGMDTSLLSSMGGLACFTCGRVALFTWPEFKQKANAIALAYIGMIAERELEKLEDECEKGPFDPEQSI